MQSLILLLCHPCTCRSWQRRRSTIERWTSSSILPNYRLAASRRSSPRKAEPYVRHSLRRAGLAVLLLLPLFHLAREEPRGRQRPHRPVHPQQENAEAWLSFSQVGVGTAARQSDIHRRSASGPLQEVRHGGLLLPGEERDQHWEFRELQLAALRVAGPGGRERGGAREAVGRVDGSEIGEF